MNTPELQDAILRANVIAGYYSARDPISATAIRTVLAALTEAQKDSARLDWLEQTALGTGPSRFLKSIFICHNMHEEGIQLDVKTEKIVSALTLRAAIDASTTTP